MQPSNALLSATSYPKTVRGMFSAIIKLTPIGLKQPLVTSQSQAGKLDMLFQNTKCRKQSQHAVTQSQAREARYTIPECRHDQSQVGKVRHTIPTYIVQITYPNIHCKICTV